MYNKTVLDRFQNPRNAGGMHGANAIGQAGNEVCSDLIKMYLKIDENSSTIENAKFKTFGCCASIAASDVACDIVKGKTIDEALKISGKDITKALGELPEHKTYCSTLAEESIRNAIEEFYKKKEKESKSKARKLSKKAQDEDDTIAE